MEDTFKVLVVGFIIVSLIGMLLLNAVNEMGNTYGMNTSEITGGSLSFSKFNSSINGLEQSSKNLNKVFNEQSIWSAIAGVVVEGFFGIAKNIVTLILLPFDIIIDIMLDVFHIPAFVTSVILGILIITIMFAIWRLIKIGD